MGSFEPMMVHTDKRVSLPRSRELEEAFQRLKRQDFWQRARRNAGGTFLAILLGAAVLLLCRLLSLL